MKIAILRGSSGEKNNDDGWYIYLTMRDMGIDVTLIEHESLIRNSKATTIYKGLNYLAKAYGLSATDVVNTAKRAHLHALKTIKRSQPDLLIIMKGMYVDREFLRTVRLALPKIKIFNYYSDNIFLSPKSLIATQECDYLFLHDSYTLEKFRRLEITNSELLFHACYPPEHKRIENLTETQLKDYACDISLIGSIYPYRDLLSNKLCQYNIKAWGSTWGYESPIDYNDAFLLTKHQNKRLDGEEKVAAYNAAKINLNTMQPIECIHGSNSRVHQVSACTAFQLHEYNPDLEKQYNVGEEIITFTSKHELVELADFYLSNKALRDSVALKAYKRAIKDHTYENRVHSLLHFYNSI